MLFCYSALRAQHVRNSRAVAVTAHAFQLIAESRKLSRSGCWCCSEALLITAMAGALFGEYIDQVVEDYEDVRNDTNEVNW